MTMPVKLASITTLLMDAIHLHGLALKLVVVKLAASDASHSISCE